MTIILNLTQHAATADQIAAGVMDLSTQEKTHLVRLLTVDNLPTTQEILDRCVDIAQIAALHEPVAVNLPTTKLLRNCSRGIRPYG